MIAENSSGDINLDGLINITGSLGCDETYPEFTGTQITSIHSKSLTSIGDQLTLYVAPLIKNISFPNLQSVGGVIYIGEAPLLTSIDLSSVQTLGTWLRIFLAWKLTELKFPMNANGEHTQAGIGITATALKDLNNFISTPGGVYFTDNYFMEELTIDVSGTTFFGPNNQPLDGIGAIVVANNSAAVNVSLPNLSSTDGYIQVDNCSALSIPALYKINGSFTMQNASFRSLEAPNLGVVNGALNITGSFSG